MKRLLYIVLILVVAVGGYSLWLSRQKSDTSSFGVEAAEANTINIDYARQIATGSPLIFGGVHAPNVMHQDAWDLLADVGVTLLRQDFYIDEALPKNISLDDYKNNKNGVQDPAKWNWTTGWSNLNNTESIYANAKNRGIKVMGIVTYAPAWLTYTNTAHGVPKDWAVYEDLVKKSYKIFRPFLDYVEIWNEPNYRNFLVVTGSNMSQDEAYLQIFKHAARAIRQVDTEAGDGKIMPIGGPVSYLASDASDLAVLLSDPEAASYLGFVSYHNYDSPEPSWEQFKAVMRQFHKENLPIYITEWMSNSDASKSQAYTLTDLGIPFTASKLIQYLKMGLAGANYYSLAQNIPQRVGTEFAGFGFYQNINGKSQALPQGKTWRLLSKSLALGSGPSRVVLATSNSGLESAGFINSLSQHEVAVVNSSSNLELVQVTANHTGIFGRATVKVYQASSDENGAIPVCTAEVSVQNGSLTFKTLVPGQSVAGILITPAELSLARLMRVLGTSTSSTCLSE